MCSPCNIILIICLVMFSEWPPRSTNLRNQMTRQIWEPLPSLAIRIMLIRIPLVDPMFLRELKTTIPTLVPVDSKKASTMPSIINHSQNRKYLDSIVIKRMKIFSKCNNYVSRSQVSRIYSRETSLVLKTPTTSWTRLTIQKLLNSEKSTKCPSKSSMLPSFKMTFT